MRKIIATFVLRIVGNHKKTMDYYQGFSIGKGVNIFDVESTTDKMVTEKKNSDSKLVKKNRDLKLVKKNSEETNKVDNSSDEFNKSI